MPRQLGYKGKKRNQDNCSVGAQAKETLEKIDANNPVIVAFKKYSQDLDFRKDKFERLVKVSRDIALESKRIIFLLHTIDRDSKKTSVLEEAKTRLETLAANQFLKVAEELHGEDPYFYHKAYTSGMQEFMEAFTFFDYLKNDKFFHWEHYQNKLKYLVDDVPDVGGDNPKAEGETCKKREIYAPLIPSDYILGLADVTGELMRKCINSLGAGDVEKCFETCNFVRSLHSGFITVGVFGNKEMSCKAYTLRQSLLKMEMVCYNIHVRGSEIPKHMLADVDTQNTFTEDDEGFFG